MWEVTASQAGGAKGGTVEIPTSRVGSDPSCWSGRRFRSVEIPTSRVGSDVCMERMVEVK